MSEKLILTYSVNQETYFLFCFLEWEIYNLRAIQSTYACSHYEELVRGYEAFLITE